MLVPPRCPIKTQKCIQYLKLRPLVDDTELREVSCRLKCLLKREKACGELQKCEQHQDERETVPLKPELVRQKLHVEVTVLAEQRQRLERPFPQLKEGHVVVERHGVPRYQTGTRVRHKPLQLQCLGVKRHELLPLP